MMNTISPEMESMLERLGVRIARVGSNGARNNTPAQPKTTYPKYQAVVGSLRSDNSVSFSEKPHIHTSEVSVRAEVERLAKANPEKTFLYAELKGFAKASGVTWS